MIGIDTKVLLRLLLDDEPAQAARIEAWLARAPQTTGQVHIADVVLAEATSALASVYKQPKASLLTALQAPLSEPMFSFEDRQALAAAVLAFQTASCGFSDCLIVAKNLALGCAVTVTFDARMQLLTGAEGLPNQCGFAR